MAERPEWMTERGGLWLVVPILPSDYTDYGGEVERWSDPEKTYPDCSCCCKWFVSLDPDNARDGMHASHDFGICANPNSPRAGFLTWEHQHGEGCGYEWDDASFPDDQGDDRMTFRDLPRGALFYFAHNNDIHALCQKMGANLYEGVFRNASWRLDDDSLEVVRYERPEYRPPHVPPTKETP